MSGSIPLDLSEDGIREQMLEGVLAQLRGKYVLSDSEVAGLTMVAGRAARRIAPKMRELEIVVQEATVEMGQWVAAIATKDRRGFASVKEAANVD